MRLIDADVLHMKNGYSFQAQLEIEKTPTIDAVPAVRCKDCKHYLGLAECEFEGHFSGGTDYFCSYGEKAYD